MQSNMVQNSPTIMGALQKNILERISLMAQEQIQLEFQEELAELRADTSLTKQVMSADAALERQQMADQSKRNDFGRNFKKN